MHTEQRKQLETWDREHVWHAFTQMAEYQPFIIERAEGCRLFDLEGNAYIDGVSSLWCNVHGHRHPKLDAAIREQLNLVAHVTNLGVSNPTTIRLARRLTEIAPPGLQHVFFSSDGASALEVAIKLAMQYWRQRPDPKPEKSLYIAFENAYHGDTVGGVSISGVARFQAMFQPLLFEVLRLPSPSANRKSPSAEHLLRLVEIELAQHHARTAALIVEPLIQCAAGMMTHPTGFLRGLRDLTKKYNVLLVADEVATGFGRTGRMFACQHEGVSPDLLCLGKGLTGGYLPMAATMATDEIWNAFSGTYAESRTFFHGHTYGGNPLAAAVALASLEVFDEERVLEQLQPKIARLGEHLARIAEHPHVGDVRQCGFMAGIELVLDKQTGAQYPWEEKRGIAVCDAARRLGVWLRPLGNVIVVMPPLSISLEALDQICTAVATAIETVC